MEHGPRLSKTDFARALRKGATHAEWELWDKLRKRQIDGIKFSFQVPIDKYIADFCCRSHRLVIEVDGFTHETRREKDAERDRAMRELGYEVLRFTEQQVFEEMSFILALIRETLEGRAQWRY